MPSIAAFNVDIDKGYTNASTFTFTNQSTSDLLDAAVWEYLWVFGDGTTSEEEHPTHTYSEEGEYIVVLTTNDGTDIVPDPLPEPPPPPLTNTSEAYLTIYNTVTISGDPYSTAASAMKQYGDIDNAVVYDYKPGMTSNRTLIPAGETIYIHATQVPAYLYFLNTDPNDTDHYNADIVGESYLATLIGIPIEEWEVGTTTVILTLTQTLTNGEIATDIKEFDLTFGNHPHLPLWGSDPPTATIGSTYSQVVKAIDDDLMGDTNSGDEELAVVVQTSGEIGTTGINAVALPNWVSATVGSTIQEDIDGVTKSTCAVTFNGTPGDADLGTTLVTLVVTDSYDNEMIKVFGLVVE